VIVQAVRDVAEWRVMVMSKKKNAGIGFFEKYLTLWVAMLFVVVPLAGGQLHVIML
jgi:hypothetical protein